MVGIPGLTTSTDTHTITIWCVLYPFHLREPTRYVNGDSDMSWECLLPFT